MPERHRAAGRDLSASPTSFWSKRGYAGLELELVLGDRLKHFLERAIRARCGKMDHAFCGTGVDVESARAYNDVRRESYHRRFGREHDRRGIRARTSGSWFLGLRTFRNSDHDPDNRSGRCGAAIAAVRSDRLGVPPSAGGLWSTHPGTA